MDHPGIVLIAPACAMTSENDYTEVFLTILNTGTKWGVLDAKVENDNAM